ncbi:hypothetical protein B0H11DRAFT_2432224 [Mycena galericulata]|nr:hypothetical protein B0H11DRAFT_2432224 [Mycena galericulata]
MSGVQLLSIDIFSEIMLNASSIDEKFALAQVSRLWRDVALGTPLLWSSVTMSGSIADRLRFPLVLSRSGPATALHIRFQRYHYEVDDLDVLVPYAPRIETLDLEFWGAVGVTVLLSSHLHLPALRALRLHGQWCPKNLSLSISAPDLRSLEIVNFRPADLDELLGPSLRDIRLSGVWAGMRTLHSIFARCPLAWRVELNDRHRESP